MALLLREAPAALLLILGCAGGGDGVRRDLEALRAEVRALRLDNEELSRKVEAIDGRVEVISTRLGRAAQREEGAAVPLVPPDLAVVKVEPPSWGPRRPPPLPTAVALAEPDPERLESLSRRSGRELAQDAEDELERARRRSGAARAHALEDFVQRYPRHPASDNALVEAAAAYAEAGKLDAACDLARRATDDYPAGDGMSDALERLAWCESRRGSLDGERRLLERLVSEYPRTSAAARAGTRLATITGRDGESPRGPARSGP